MIGKRLVFFAIYLALILCSMPGFAEEKATDLMALALKNKAAGKTRLAIEQLEKAVVRANNSMQKNLARFMLGDCQLESGKYSEAARTYEELRRSSLSQEEKAESIYRLLQAETMLNHSRKARTLFSEIKKNHKSSPYYELARAFVNANNLDKGVTKVLQAPKSKPAVKPVKKAEPVEKPKAVSKPIPQAVPTPPEKQEKNKEKIVTAPVKRKEKIKTESSSPKITKEQADLIKTALNIETNANKDQLVAEILQLQDNLNANPTDKSLFDLAQKTLAFGETLEACKLFDRLLSEFPNSSLTEESYYHAIRLRAALGVHEAVLSWGKVFLATFPASEYADQVRALLIYSKKKGLVDLSSAIVSKNVQTASQKLDDSDRLKQDSNYIEAARKMKDGRYNLALIDLNNLARQYPQASQVWWDLALVYVQFENFPAAEKAVTKMLAIQPDNEEGNSLLGYIHYRLEDYQQAASAYDKAGTPKGNGINFFDAQKAAERMKKSVNTGK